MTTDDVLDAFRKAGALLEGHFILSSGRRSPVFLQKALVFSRPDVSEALCKALAAKITARFGKIDVVAGPAVGGIVPGYETARHLGARAIFAEVLRISTMPSGLQNAAWQVQMRFGVAASSAVRSGSFSTTSRPAPAR